MTVTCSRCKHLPGAGRQPKEWTRLGLYRCSKLPKWTFVSPIVERDCETFARVADADLPARIKFEDSLRSMPKADGGSS